MQSSDFTLEQSKRVTVFCDQDTTFNRNFLALVKHWDKRGNINILPSLPAVALESEAQKTNRQSSLLAVDENGVKWNGAEAVPIIFKNLPFGKLAAAMYILPGTMWVTKQLCDLEPARQLPQK